MTLSLIALPVRLSLGKIVLGKKVFIWKKKIIFLRNFVAITRMCLGFVEGVPGCFTYKSNV
jgi:hypothetical protein